MEIFILHVSGSGVDWTPRPLPPNVMRTCGQEAGINLCPPPPKRGLNQQFPNFQVVIQMPANVVVRLETTLLESCVVLHRFLGAFAKLRRETLSYMSVSPHGTTRLPLYGFYFISEDFSKICWENSSFIKIWLGKCVLKMKAYIFVFLALQPIVVVFSQPGSGL